MANVCYSTFLNVFLLLPRFFTFLTFSIFPIERFYARKQLLLWARLSHRNSVCLSHGWISQKRCKL